MRNILIILALALVGCASDPMPVAPAAPLYQEGDQVCVVVGSTPVLFVLQEDIAMGQQGALAVSGSTTTIVDSDYFVDLESCMGGRNVGSP